jgi:predicted transcriptional regulator
MPTISISVDDKTKGGIDRLAKQTRRSRSDVVREMYLYYSLRLSAQALERAAQPALQKHKLHNEEAIAAYADAGD